MNTRTRERPIAATRSKTRVEESIPISRALLVSRAKRRLASGFYDCEGIVDAVVELILSRRPKSRKAGRQAEARSRTSTTDRAGRVANASKRRQSAA